MKLPKTLKLGPFDYTVGRHKYENNKDNHLGWIQHAKQEISIADDIVEDAQREVVLHELLHGSWANSMLSKVNGLRDHEELIVSALSVHLMGIFRDNKQLKEVLFV